MFASKFDDALYSSVDLVTPKESDDYNEKSSRAISIINEVFIAAIEMGDNKIRLDCSLRSGVPTANIAKISGFIIEQWALETLEDYVSLIDDVTDAKTVGSSGNISDVDISFTSGAVASIDVKTTNLSCKRSGRNPNITSFYKIREAYATISDFMFIVLSLKYKYRTMIDSVTGNRYIELEITHFSVFDFKSVAPFCLLYNSTLKQFQIRDMCDVRVIPKPKSVSEFCRVIDGLFISHKKNTIDDWFDAAMGSANRATKGRKTTPWVKLTCEVDYNV